MARGGLYNHIDFSEGILTPDDLNDAHRRHIENLYPEKIDDFAEDLDMFKITQNPKPSGVVLPVTLAQEIASLRFMIAAITGETNWYDNPPENLIELKAVIEANVGTSTGGGGATITTSGNKPNNTTPGGDPGDLHIRVTSTRIEFYIKGNTAWPNTANSSVTIVQGAAGTKVRTGGSDPNNGTGANGDLWLKINNNVVELWTKAAGAYSKTTSFSSRINVVGTATLNPSTDYLMFEDSSTTNNDNKKSLFSNIMKTSWVNSLDALAKASVADSDLIVVHDTSASQAKKIKLKEAVRQVQATTNTDDLPSGFITGEIRALAFNTVPTGWLECRGQSVSRVTYRALYDAIGTTWGSGDGSTTFTLPDLRRRTLIGKGGTKTNGPNNTVGSTGGAESVTLTTAQLPSHSHGKGNLSASSGGAHTHGKGTLRTNNTGAHTHKYYHNASGGSLGWRGSENPSRSSQFNTDSAGSHSHTISGSTASGGSHTHTITGSTDTAGSGNAHNNMQPSAVVMYVIKT